MVEVISQESLSRDRSDKFYEYQNAGVREYWIVDPRPQTARCDFWVLNEQGMYRPILPSAEGIYRATVLPDFWLRTAWLLSDSRPDPLLAFAEIAGLPDEVIATLQRLAHHGSTRHR